MSILSVILFVGGALGNSCPDSTPLSLPISDVQIRPDISQSLVRGVAATIGTPPQNIALLPWPELNNTFVYDGRGYCDKTVIWNDLICEVRRGGLYQSDSSTTFVRHSDLVDAGGASIEAQLSGSELGIGELMSSSVGADDNFALNQQNLDIANMPVGIPRFAWDHGYSLMHGMGMGRNSTLLSSLHSAGKIGSKVWSIFWGRMWVDDAIDGSLVLGGYDSDKVIGNNFTAPLDYSDKTGCWTGMKARSQASHSTTETGPMLSFSTLARSSPLASCPSASSPSKHLSP